MQGELPPNSLLPLMNEVGLTLAGLGSLRVLVVGCLTSMIHNRSERRRGDCKAATRLLRDFYISPPLPSKSRISFP
jgi:hypothetical protein